MDRGRGKGIGLSQKGRGLCRADKLDAPCKIFGKMSMAVVFARCRKYSVCREIVFAIVTDPNA